MNDAQTTTASKTTKSNLHEFLLIHLTKAIDDQELRKLYADFKSRGGVASAAAAPATTTTTSRRLILKETTDSSQSSMDKSRYEQQQQQQQRLIKSSQQFDCLDIFNRQQLAVLFYSQCETSPVYPNICIKPRIINMKFYGENDMTLGSYPSPPPFLTFHLVLILLTLFSITGAFLAKNCFRNGYKCNNEMCETLIVYHTRT